MADNASPVNGVFATQYSQPAELAASTPSGPTHAPSASQSTVASAAVQKADPTEIGWYFVEQYYTTLSKSPERIHLFYSKKSQLVSGNEAEKVIPAVGIKAISDKIKSLDIQDCKVRVLNVDSQASFNNIVVQVIGEMSNKNQPHHKFVQTFVLAEQPNGYFVLNDIFRYLNDDEDEIIDDEAVQPDGPAEEPTTSTAAAATTVAEATESVEAAATTTSAAAAEAAAPTLNNGVEETKEASVAHAEPTTKAKDISSDAQQTTNTPVPASATAQTAPAEAATQPAEATPSTSEASEAPAAPTPAAPAAPATTTVPAPASDAPPAKKTWASMLGGNATPAVPALPAKQASPAPAQQQQKQPRPTAQNQPKPTPTEPAAAASSSPAQGNGWQTAGDNKKGRAGAQAKANDGNVLAYIKNVTDKVEPRALRETLERFGDLKYFDVSRQRNCAFVEFATPEGYAAAAAANPHTVNSEVVSVEERRPRPGAYGAAGAQFARGNNGQANRPRGGSQQPRSGSQNSFPKDAGRSTAQQQQPQQRTVKSGTVTPRGRGQAQAA